MNPRTQSAGTCGIVAGIALAIAFLLFISSGATPSTFADPAKALDFIGKNTSRLRLAIAFSLITIAFATVFLAGLAAKLRDKTPTRATAVLYLGVLGPVGHAVGSMLFGTSAPLGVAYAAKDQVAAPHAISGGHSRTSGAENGNPLTRIPTPASDRLARPSDDGEADSESFPLGRNDDLHLSRREYCHHLILPRRRLMTSRVPLVPLFL